jgi:hypothetical protein
MMYLEEMLRQSNRTFEAMRKEASHLRDVIADMEVEIFRRDHPELYERGMKHPMLRPLLEKRAKVSAQDADI